MTARVAPIECQGRHFDTSVEHAGGESAEELEMLVIGDETLRDVGQVRMISTAAFDQPDELFMIPILDPVAMAQSN